MLKKEEIYKHNPIHIANYQISNLDSITGKLLNILDEIAKDQNLSDEELNEIRETIQRIYIKKKASYFIEEKMTVFFEYLTDACNVALKSKKGPHHNDYTELTYVNHTKKLLTNEQY